MNNSYKSEPLYQLALADLLDAVEANQSRMDQMYDEDLLMLCAQIRLECGIPRENNG